MGQLQDRVAKEVNSKSLSQSIASLIAIAVLTIPIFSFSSGWGWWTLINGIIFGAITSEMARKRGRSMANGLLGGYIFGILAVIYYLIAGDTPDMKAAKAEDSRIKLGISTGDKKQTHEELIEELNYKYNTPETRPAPIALKVVGGISALLLVAIIVSVMTSGEPTTYDNSASSTDTYTQVENRRSEIISTYAPQYCEKRGSTILTGMPEDWPVNDSYGWLPEECESIIGKVYDSSHYDNEQNKEEEAQRVTDGTYWIDMSEVALLYSLGNPRDVNTTRTTNHTRKQYVYGGLGNATYIYVEDGKVTTIQN